MSPLVLCSPRPHNATVSTITLTPLQAAALPALQQLRDDLLAPHAQPGLAEELTDVARGHGQHACLAWRRGQAVGCAGWVLQGVEQDGCGYGAPLLAADQEVASLLIARVIAVASEAGAKRLRIGSFAAESAKQSALLAAGFVPVFEFVHWALPLPIAGTTTLPAGLRSLPYAEIDWPALRACYAQCFQQVPNAPVPDVAAMQEEWSAADWTVSRVLVDEQGHYQAFLLVSGEEVDAVGVMPALQGRGLAAALYAQAGEALRRRGVSHLHAMVASSNGASMALHERLGGYEHLPRRTVYQLSLC
ncbi:hypothetical protein GCM10007907_02150 [Chitinimonas prasina]|uniref:N-acetyltransferase domain-containing protein n=1 Tax=Chitinimonas prasina TaxID=1434937 RepID=A0ABQ5YDK4_9NEIS|nr:GNAT family N-acetyltransferase [Chitinimonas prasina]GLR11425.1 hypothetical protein GCM10007907_02150 [Chitinimonas prasina]